MDLVLNSIGDRGNLSEERISISVTKACNLKFHLVFSTKMYEKGFYNRSEKTYWFYPKEVKAGDKIVLYTKTGTDSYKENPDGSKTYFLYWGLNASLFINSDDGVVLAEISNWSLSLGLV
ncbi:MAG: hypothetical protein V2B15_08680 [Bacteroidota bacterium]